MIGWVVQFSATSDAHVVPIADTHPHNLDCTCWCRPERDLEDDRVVYHNSADRREDYEEGRRQLN